MSTSTSTSISVPLPTSGDASTSTSASLTQAQNVRLFVGGLPADITAPDLVSRFSHFGSVAAVDIVQRKGPLDDSGNVCMYVRTRGRMWTMKTRSRHAHTLDTHTRDMHTR